MLPPGGTGAKTAGVRCGSCKSLPIWRNNAVPFSVDFLVH
jgi:hypothetical protein